MRDRVNAAVHDFGGSHSGRDGNSQDWGPVHNCLQALAEDLGRIDRLAREAVSLAESKHGRSMQRLDQIDQIVMGTDSRQVIGFLMQPLIHEITRGSAEYAADSDPLDKTAEVYRQIGRSARIHEDLIRTTLNRLPPVPSP